MREQDQVYQQDSASRSGCSCNAALTEPASLVRTPKAPKYGPIQAGAVAHRAEVLSTLSSQWHAAERTPSVLHALCALYSIVLMGVLSFL